MQGMLSIQDDMKNAISGGMKSSMKHINKDMFLDDFCPDQFACPIGCEVMLDPVKCADGHTYERENIASWLQRSSISPLTNEELRHKRLESNDALKAQIYDYLMQLEASKQVRLP
jgi:hypothetical protein